MGKRGPKPSVDPEDRLRVLTKYKQDIFTEGGFVRQEGDPIWIKLCDILNENNSGEKIKTKNLQIYVSQNRNGILDDLELNKLHLVSHVEKDKQSHKSDEVDNNQEKQLINLQSDALYKPIIKEIAPFPLTILQSWNEVYSAVSSLVKSENIGYIFGIVGSFCKNFVAPDGHSSEKVYLCALGIQAEGEFVPICQISTEKLNSVSTFTRFISKSLKEGLAVPSKIDIDYIWDHFVAMNSVFNVNWKPEQYLLSTFIHLLRENQHSYILSANKEFGKELPRCVITANHRFLIGEVMQWECIKNKKNAKIRRFQIYCVIVLSMQKSLDDFQKTLEYIFGFSYSKFQSKSSKMLFDFIMDKVDTLHVDDIYKEIIENMRIVEEIMPVTRSADIVYKDCEFLVEYIKYVFIKSKQYIHIIPTSEDHERNAFYDEEFIKNLMKLCVQFVIWSNVMTGNEYSNTNHGIKCIDSYRNGFAEFLNSQPAIDIFLMKNIEYVDKKLKILRVPMTTAGDLNTEKINKIAIDLEHTYLDHEENWRGKNSHIQFDYSSDSEESTKSYTSESDGDIDYDADHMIENSYSFKESTYSEIVESVCQEVFNEHLNEQSCHAKQLFAKPSNVEDSVDYKNTDNQSQTVTNQNDKVNKKPGKFVSKCPDIEFRHQKPSKNSRKRAVLKNSNLLKPKLISKCALSVLTSSLFDCIVEVITSVYFNISDFNNFIDNMQNILEDTKQDFFNIVHTYVNTLSVKELYSSRMNFLRKVFVDFHNNKLCWTKFIGDFYERVMYPNIFSKSLCVECNTFVHQYSNRINLSLKELISENVESIIYNQIKSKSGILCEKCDNKMLLSQIDFQNLLCIDVESTEMNINESSIKLCDLKKKIELDSKQFMLVGIIGYKEPIGHEFRHYIAYSRNTDASWFEYNDVAERNKPVRIANLKKCVNLALVIYIIFNPAQNTEECGVDEIPIEKKLSIKL